MPGEGVEAPATTGQGASSERSKIPNTRAKKLRHSSSVHTRPHYLSIKSGKTCVMSEQVGEVGYTTLEIQTNPVGWLAHFVANWQLITKDQWILDTVRGYRISFTSHPHQERKPHESFKSGPTKLVA